MPIQLLSPQLANQIAAGEVVERPASVVKELLENSLDAGATKIEVDIEKGGHKRIRIKDNGQGIAKDELKLALSRHATSKIFTLDDLEQILSLGFRGEALASISSVSRLTLTSRTAEQSEAWQAHCEGREMQVNVQPAAHPIGTTIDVADLFYNTPARRKFLRTEKTEFQHIEEVIKRIALSYPNVSFVLKHNDKVVKRYIADAEGSLSSRIGAVVGNKFIQNAVHIHTDYEGISIDAWLGNETMLRSSNDCQFSFVNGRGMRDKLIMHAIRQAYETVWGVIEQPSFVVYLSLSPKDVDVNVHPAKHEVRFQQGRLVHDFICKSVSDALHSLTDKSVAPATSGHAFEMAEVAHDYIRPLQESHSQQGGGRAFHSVMPSQGRGDSGYVRGPTSSEHKGMGAFQRTAKGPSAAYQSQFNALMTPNSDKLTANQQDATNVQCLNVSPQRRIYAFDEKVFLLSAAKLASVWLSELFLKAEHGQPLLMPVAIQHADVDSHTLEVLQAFHFDINKVAGKFRLQQVPAGTRHFPWIKWFAHLLCTEFEKNTQNTEALAPAITIPERDLPDDIALQVWGWMEALDDLKQWEYISQFAKVRPLKSVLDVWGE
ncbi:DNA mismatch repair endonuclease MutL [Alteromonas sp. D210916BOD_24]|uniref:DNA mismatch repair endonuclease MutL n=1 Tax=Alteromonas sp. D210916BOD_24 TaxID=3157618 RepID=UPI00399C5939